MIPAVVGLASGTILLLSRGEDDPAPLHVSIDGFSHREDGIEVPLALTRKQWLSFLKAATCGNPRTITPSFRLGVFGLTVRRLCDLGAMANPKVIHYQGRQVWDAHWLNPSSLATFQAAPMLQYTLFTDSIKRYFAAPDIAQAVGQVIEGQKVTQSGALMLAHRAGLSGMTSWLQDPSIRERFSNNTTAFFHKANGIF
ncbi:MAG: hypothetical protein PHS34_08730 [Candidatus Omnitrophica bacterium]|nr:hypothetical protein [Candidatus Omnitrophota bacterium]